VTLNPSSTIDFSQLAPTEFEFDPSERPRLENQAEFVRYFSEPGSGGCSGGVPPDGDIDSYRGPYLCFVEFGPPLVSEAVVIETVVGDDQTTPGEPGSPDDRPMLTVAMTESRQLIEPILADLYTWALDTYPEDTEAACGVGFTGDDEAIAWNPGYRADIPCGEHLLDHLDEFMEYTRP